MDNGNSKPHNLTVDSKKIHEDISQSINGLHSLINGHFGSLQQDITELLKRKDVLLDVTKVIDVSMIPDPITLNIGGFKHQTTKATLTKIPNSFFDLMLSGEIDIKPMTNKPNTYFIDRDEGDIQIPEDIRHCVKKEMEFYKINDHFKLDDTTTIIDQLNSLKLKLDETEQEFNSTKQELTETKQELALSKEESKKELENLKQEVNSLKDKDKLLDQINNSKLPFSLILNQHTFKIIRNWIDKTKLTNFELLYSASKTNRFKASIFHLACDGEGPTITVIETTDGCVFGGYNSQSWNSKGFYYGDNKCFIFTLVNKHGTPPTKYRPKENLKYFVVGHSDFGPVFGNIDNNDGLEEDELVIKELDSYQRFPMQYNDTTGKGKTTLTPSEYFHIKNLEIYKCS
ncbi:hypothetical protein CYY_007386 [Polysphondylium violaceum]|uniref:TLDc domain-containing protein n=1 Tax=Polysphondylium violaceum TaxID=133409 RepID=A0A8J4V292_9MYCE|nr:hypothetical protein CYY_007386 [Polysphondylium violaceum]